MYKSASSSRTIVMLTSTNYTLWKPRMEDFLNSKNLFNSIELMGINQDPSQENQVEEVE